jgi:protease-4
MKNKELIERLHSRSQLQKWRNISVILIVILLFLVFKVVGSKENIGREHYIARINIDNVIESNNYMYNKLEHIRKDNTIKAVIVNINTPGGEVVASEVIFNKLRRISEKKPIVVVMGNLAASGGYMISLASDYIIAGNGTITGSIGVILQTYEVVDLMKKIGVNPLIYKSSDLKATPSMYEKPTLKVDKVLNESIKDSHEFFMEMVSKRRNISMQKTKILADGRIYTGRQALKVGLVDEIGYEEEAVEYLKSVKDINTDKLRIYDYEIYEPLNDFNVKNFLGSMLNIKSLNQNEKSGMMAIYK